MARHFTEQELRGAAPVWILDLTYAGRVWRFSTEAVEIDGNIYEATMSDVGFSDVIEWASSDFALPSADIKLVFREDIARLVQQGHDLSGATGELALWIKGSDYDDRRVVVSGRANVAQYGQEGEPVTFSLEADWLDNSSLYPPAAAVITEVTWPISHENSRGKVYPTVFGSPAMSPVYGCEIFIGATGLIAGHEVEATQVTIHGSELTTPAVLNVVYANDDLGYQVATVDLTAIPTVPPGLDQTFWCEWTHGEAHPNPYRTDSEALTAAGDIIRWALERSGLVIDYGRTITAVNKLMDYQLSGFIGEIGDVMTWLKEEVLALLPVSLMAGADGIYPVVWDHNAPSVTQLRAGGDIYRDGPVKYEDNEIRNEISIKWGYSAQTTDFSNRSSLTGDQVVVTSDLVGRNIYTISSRSRYGSRAYEVESSMVGDMSTAGRILAWMSQSYAFKHRSVTYRAPIDLGWLAPGDIIELTDSSISMTEQRVMVREIQWGDTEIGLDLLLIPDLPRDTIVL